MALEV